MREETTMTESPKNNVQEIWQCQPVEGIKMSVEEIRGRATKFEKKIWWRNLREYAAGAIAAVLLGFSFASAHNPLDRIAFALLIAGMGYALYQLHRHGQARNLPVVMGMGPSLQFYRSELERQRDLASNVWTWYLGPFIPGLLLSMIASMLHDTHLRHLSGVAFWYAVMAAFFIFVWRLNARAARCLQRMLDELRAVESSH
jgi:hypothetical protein